MDAGGGSSTERIGAVAGAQPPQRPSWRPRHLVAYAATTSSGSTYTSGSSHLQSSSGDGGLAPPVALSTLLELEEEREKTCRHIRSLVQEFSAAVSDKEATTLVLERFFSDLGISWVVSIATNGKSPAAAFVFPRRLGDLARSWIDALTAIRLSIFTNFDGLCNQEEGTSSSLHAASDLARFLQSTLLKMIPFADAVVSAKVNGACIQHNLWEAMVPGEDKLHALIGVRHALSEASAHIQMWSLCAFFQGSGEIVEQMSSLLSAKLAKLDEAVWDTVDALRSSIVTPPTPDNHNAADSMDSQALELERTPVIHKATRSIVNCINVISADYGLVSRIIVSKAASLGKHHVPQENRMCRPFNADPLAMLIWEMVSCLQENLARVSQPFSDKSLRFLFLLNNTHFMWQQLHHPSSYGLELYVPGLASKIDEHIQRYLQASWIPVVSRLHGPIPTPHCFGRYKSTLAKFEADFQKTYTAQKLRKVPDPELRRRLRKAIIETVIPAFAKYQEDNKMTSSRVIQQEPLQDMLQGLFEG
ncbi:unnamed protein product [Urochloa decumbens]|uniref:Exocyst subunit Exo70 family protein n=1 Tax=Urochloa decumbens TaxID=240449 RepID=A0ABC8VHT1_9POAL